MTESTNNPNEIRALDDNELNEVVGGKLPDFMYELVEEFEPEKREEILRYFRTNGANIAEPYRYMILQLRKIRDYDNAKRVEEYFNAHYHHSLRP